MKRILDSLILIALVISSVTMGALAVWTDQATNANNTFTTGTIDISLIGHNPLPFSVSAMGPGESITSTLDILNNSRCGLFT